MSRAPCSEAGLTALDSHPQGSFSGHKAPKGERRPASPLIEGNHLMRHIDRAPPGDIVRKTSKTQPRADLTRQKSKRNFFEGAFSDNPLGSARERVHRDAIVMAEVKTNVIISDEFTFITELSYHLSTRYQRPVSSIVVTLRHGACMFFGGSFDPAYVMSVFALPSQLPPTTNKRNAALIQKHMEETLGVGVARGFLRFVPIQEEHLACNGKTTAAEIDELERSVYHDAVEGVMPSPTAAEDGAGAASRGMRVKRMLSVKSLAALRLPSAADIPTPELTPPSSADEAWPSPVSHHKTKEDMGLESPSSPQRKAAQRKKSFVATILGRSGRKSSDRSCLPAIADV